MLHRNARLVATGRHVPEIEVSNDRLRRQLPAEFVDKMEQRTGIGTRFYAPETWATSDVALPAARQALERAGRAPEDVDLVIVGTDSPDYITPSTSVVLQQKLGATRAGTFDVGCACASFPSGVAIGAGLIAANPALETVLVVGVYLMHRLADPEDPMIFFYGETHTVMEKWGYTGSACVPMALDDAIESGKAGPGDLVVLVGSGVGYNQAGAAWKL